MMREVLGATEYASTAVGALLFFMSFFVVVVLWTYRRGARGTYEQASWLPLDEVGGARMEGGSHGADR